MANIKKFNKEKEIRAIARERLGSVRPSHPILPKSERKRPKHKKPIDPESCD